MSAVWVRRQACTHHLGFRRARARPDARASDALVRSRVRPFVRTFMTTSREDARDAPRRCGAGGAPLQRDTEGSPGARRPSQLAGPRAGQRASRTGARYARHRRSSNETPRRSSEGNQGGRPASRRSHRSPRRASRRASSTPDSRAGAAMTRCALTLSPRRPVSPSLDPLAFATPRDPGRLDLVPHSAHFRARRRDPRADASLPRTRPPAGSI